MNIVKFETWILARNADFFDEERKAGSPMPWDVVVLRLTDEEGASGVATVLAARSGEITARYLTDIIAPVILGKESSDREAIQRQLYLLDRHMAFFPNFLPGPVDVALWDLAARKAGLPLYRYLGGCRQSLPVYASGLFHKTIEEYQREAVHYKERGIKAYKCHPCGPWQKDMEIVRATREAVGSDFILMADPVGEYTLDQAIRMGRLLEKLDYRWFEEPFRDVEIEKYARLCASLDIPVANTETVKGDHRGISQYILSRATDIVRADVSWKWGVTGSLKVAHLAEAFGLNCEIHTTTMAYMDMANLHVSCAIGNCEFFEWLVPEYSFCFPLREPLAVDGEGMIQVGDGPGIGVDMDWELVRRHEIFYKAMEA